MKKIIAMLLASLWLGLASARENITIIYAFGVGDITANYGRFLAEEANRSQDRYNFLFDVKPGAGGVIAANYVLNSPNHILQTSSSFWVRPTVFPQNSYDVSKFKMLMTQCQAPFAIGSTKFRSMKDVPKDQRTTIGVAGVGVITHLIAIRMQQSLPMLDIIPYKSPSEAAIAAQSGQVDFVAGFISDIERYADRGMNLLGVTGTQSQGKYPTLVSFGLHSSLGQMSLTHHLQVPDSWSVEKTREVREILLRAETSRSIRDSYALDRCQPVSTNDRDLVRWREDHAQSWSGLARGVKVD